MTTRWLTATAFAAMVLGGPVLAQDKPTLSKYLAEGYEVLHVEGGGGQFAFFILKKDKTLVHCSVLLQSGETSSCRPLK